MVLAPIPETLSSFTDLIYHLPRRWSIISWARLPPSPLTCLSSSRPALFRVDLSFLLLDEGKVVPEAACWLVASSLYSGRRPEPRSQLSEPDWATCYLLALSSHLSSFERHRPDLLASHHKPWWFNSTFSIVIKVQRLFLFFLLSFFRSWILLKQMQLLPVSLFLSQVFVKLVSLTRKAA